MPIYVYRCESCGHQDEVLQKMSDPLLTQCPECGRDTFSKQVTAAGFQLKGSGWYVTDFRNGGGTSKPAVDVANGAKTGAEPGTAAPAGAKSSNGADAAKPDGAKADAGKSSSTPSASPSSSSAGAAAASSPAKPASKAS